MGDHTEALQLDYDPMQIAFAEIAQQFWKHHNPLRPGRHHQYMSAIWFHDAQQRDTVMFGRQSVERELAATVQTPVLPFEQFYVAEDYHQKYRLQNSPLMKYFDAMFTRFEDFTNSTAAARVNALLAGYVTGSQFAAEGDAYGIPREELQRHGRISGSAQQGSIATNRIATEA